MQYHNQHKKDSTLIIRMVSAIVFCLFSFLWLYWFQQDILTLSQHILSHQQTHYNNLISAIIVTAVLLIVQQMVSKLIRLRNHSYALSFVPSMLLLAIYSDIHPTELKFFTYRAWWMIVPVVLIIWGGIIWLIKQLFEYDDKGGHIDFPARQLWINLTELCCMMFAVALLGNTNAAKHYQTHVENAIRMGDFDEALRTGASSHENNVRLTMLRAYALSKKGQLGERLFEYPVAGTSDNLVPLSDEAKKVPLLFPLQKFYLHFGALPIAISSTKRYFELLEKDSLASDAVRDYRLCGMLIDRNIDGFVNLLPNYYDSLKTLPKHYREALVLYNHQNGHAAIEYRDTLMEEDWKNFRDMQDAVAMRKERKDRLCEQYATSYWNYYYSK